MNKNLETFLEDVDFSFLRSENNEITKKHREIWENVYLPSQLKKVTVMN